MQRCLLGILAMFAPIGAGAEPMVFAFDCHANATESCFIIAEGALDGGAAMRFEAFVDDPDNGVEGFQILLHSPGGNLRDGIELGRRIRARGLHTVVGRYDIGNFDRPIAPGECLSACAYAFIGGEGRRVSEESRLGFHQFGLPGGAALPDAVGLAGGQEVSGILLSYLIEMGVDPRLFVLASATPSADMLYPSREQRLDFDLETPRGFGPFWLEPYGAGIVAASKRLDAPRAYDETVQLTAFCRDGEARLMVTVPNVWAETGYDALLEVGSATDVFQIGTEDVAARKDDQNGYFEVSLNSRAAQALVAASEMELTVLAPRVAGGPHWMRRALTDMDRRMIAAAFRFCI